MVPAKWPESAMNPPERIGVLRLARRDPRFDTLVQAAPR